MRYETYPVRSKGTRLWLTRRYYQEHGKPPGAQALQDALGILEAKALFDGSERAVHVRAAGHGDALFFDLANEAREIVRVSKDGWEVVSEAPVRFRRPKSMRPLPRPVEGGSVDDLQRFVNVKDEGDWRLAKGWLVQALNPTGPYPILIVEGEQGSAKTTAARILGAVLDPSATPVRTLPKNEQDLLIAAKNALALRFDNLSGLHPGMSDALCRLSTGGGFATRELYTDSEEAILEAVRPVILTGIAGIATRADLLDRAIVLRLPKISEENRRPEKVLWAEFEAVLPGILGALLDAVGVAMRELPSVVLPSFPRMADAALWATAAEGALGMSPGEYMEAYTRGRREVNELALEADAVATAVAKLMEARDEWIGTAAELLKALRTHADEDVRHYKTWPRQPQHLSRHLKRLAPVLRAEGIEVEDLPRQGSERKKRIFKIKPGEDRHERHGRHRDPESYRSGDYEHNGGDDGVTGIADEGLGDRHEEGPIEQADSTGGDGDDGDDNGLKNLSEGVLVTNEEGLRALIPEIEAAEVVALDLETGSLDPRKDRIRLLSIATENGTWVVDNSSVDIRKLFEALENKTLVVHNAMFDILFLRCLGHRHRGRTVDTMTLSRMVHAGERGENGKRLEHSLETCCERELGLKLDKSYQDGDWSGELSDEMLAYAVEDAEVLLPLHKTLTEQIRETGQERVYEIEQRALLAGIEMAYNGVRVDKERWLGIVEEAGKGLANLRTRLDGLVCDPPEEVKKRNGKNKNVPDERKGRWNWDSPDQLKTAASTLGLTLRKTSMDQLKLINHEFTKALLAYREARSGLATYGEKFFEPKDGREVYLDGRVYPSWGMCQADTGRMGCSSPNVQNIPNKSRLGKLRGCVVAPEGRCLVKADYSQVELRIVAKIAGGGDARGLPCRRGPAPPYRPHCTRTRGGHEGRPSAREGAEFRAALRPGRQGTQGLRPRQVRRGDGSRRGRALPGAVVRELPVNKGLAPSRGLGLRHRRCLGEYPRRAPEEGRKVYGEGQPPGTGHGG